MVFAKKYKKLISFFKKKLIKNDISIVAPKICSFVVIIAFYIEKFSVPYFSEFGANPFFF